jgi:hypothetical protein
VGLFEACLLGEPDAGQTFLLNPGPQRLAQIFLQCSEFHESSIASLISRPLLTIQVQHP